MDSVEGEDPSLAFMDSIEEDFFPVAKIARSKSKGRREIMNLVSSINYGDASASSRPRKRKAHMR
jgi:hypothetical protein